MTTLNGVFIIPTGLGCSIGGDAGANPHVKLISECCKNLIVNPNSVNSSDINELPNNALYVEGSSIDRFLEGTINLHKVKTFNRIIMPVNPPITPININSCNAGIWGLGADVTIVELKTPIAMKAILNPDGTAGGVYTGVDELVEQLKDYDYDALALQTPIDCDRQVANDYWTGKLKINPWGGIESLVSKAISEKINKPVAHAPDEITENEISSNLKLYAKLVVRKSQAPEVISNCYTFCVLKGLHHAPRLELDITIRHSDILSVKDIDFLVTPHRCFRRPHIACVKNNIPIIVVMENTTCFSKDFVYPTNKGLIFVDNYLEAAGVITAMSAGVDYRTVLLDGAALY